MASHSKPFLGMITKEAADYWYHYNQVENICKSAQKLKAKTYQDAVKEAIEIDKNT